MDDRTCGLVIRALRRRRGWRQSDLASRSRLSQSTISRAERGWLGGLTVDTIRRIFGSLEARIALAPRWNGAELERLLDTDHALVVATASRRLERLGWDPVLEVTYSQFGERGSIDVLGLHPPSRSVVVIEVKTDLGSTEALGRKLDEKARLAPGIVRERFGWSPSVVARLLVMPDTMRLRRLVARHDTIRRMFPVSGVAVGRWLRHPVGAIAGHWFLSDNRDPTPGHGVGGTPRRIRRPVDPQTAGTSVARAVRSSPEPRSPRSTTSKSQVRTE